MRKAMKKIIIFAGSVILLCVLVIVILSFSKKKVYMENAEIVYNSNKCIVTVKTNGEVLSLNENQINKMMDLLEHSYTKTKPKGGFRDEININAPVYIDISYENEISINDDNVDSFGFYRIIYTYDNKFNNKLTYHIKNDSIGYNYYNMPVDDMRELEMILKIKFTNE